MSFINTVFGIPLGYVMWGCYQLEKLWFINHSVYIGQQNRHAAGIYYGTEKQYSNDTDPATDK